MASFSSASTATGTETAIDALAVGGNNAGAVSHRSGGANDDADAKVDAQLDSLHWQFLGKVSGTETEITRLPYGADELWLISQGKARVGTIYKLTRVQQTSDMFQDDYDFDLDDDEDGASAMQGTSTEKERRQYSPKR